MNIEIFSDLVCPWCYIGKRRLDLVLQSAAGEGVSVVWRAYQLYPGIAGSGMSRKEFIEKRYGGVDRNAAAAAGRSQIQIEAEALGIDLDFSRISRMPNTFQGHRLLHKAREFGVQHELADTLFHAYFELGQDLGSDEVLLEAATHHGMDPDSTRLFLAGDEGVRAVQGEIERAANIGVTGVPYFLLAGAFAIPGAQEPEVMGQIIERAKTKLAGTA
ncbi:MAG: DsbA family oxidoreductase [Pseudomonadales bacterium]